MAKIIRPTLAAMAKRGTPFRGFLYAGLMITASGPRLIEYNCRFGDPECQVVIPRLMTDLVTEMLAARDGVLKSFDLRFYPQAALCVVMAARGYPGEPLKGSVIGGLTDAAAIDGVEIFHAGTKREGDRILANGGRVLNVCAVAPSIEVARERAYAAVDKIRWPEGFCRRDIGVRAIKQTPPPD